MNTSVNLFSIFAYMYMSRMLYLLTLRFIGVGFVLGLELEVFMGWAEEHLTVRVLESSTSTSNISGTRELT